MRLNEVENMKVLIIIPAYNEEESIEKVINNLKQNYSQYDYVIINDGSHDHTSEICHKNKYKIIDLPVNLGLTGAFQTGLKYAYKVKGCCNCQRILFMISVFACKSFGKIVG